MNVDTDCGPYICSECKKEFLTLNALNRHYRAKHPIDGPGDSQQNPLMDVIMEDLAENDVDPAEVGLDIELEICKSQPADSKETGG